MRQTDFPRHAAAAVLMVAAGLALATFVVACGRQGSEPSASTSSSSPAAGGTAATSRFDRGPRAADTPRNDEMAHSGEKLFQAKGCSACHGFGVKSAGPDLAGVTRRRTAAWMEQQILHPEVMVKEDPISRGLFAQFALQMPNQGVTPEEAKAIIEYFKHKDHEAEESH